MAVSHSSRGSVITVADWHEFNQHIVRGDTIAVRDWILLKGPPGEFFNEIKPNVRNPVCTAAEHGWTEIISLLLNKGFSVTTRDVERHRDGPLHLAAYRGHFDLVERLVEVHKADVNSWSNGFTVLQRAIVGHQSRVVQYLLAKGANPNLLNPRHYPSLNRRSDMELGFRCRPAVRDVVKDSLSEANQNLLGDYLLNVALVCGARDIAHMLLRAGARYTQAVGYCIETMCAHQTPNFHVLLFVLEIRAPILYRDPWVVEGGLRECSPLACAARNGNLLPVTIMLQAGCPLGADILDRKFEALFIGPYENEVKNLLRHWLSTPCSLQDLCNFTIRQAMGFITPDKVQSLPLPDGLKRYIRLDHLLDNSLTHASKNQF